MGGGAIQSGYGFAFLTKFILVVLSKKIDNWDTSSISYMDTITLKFRDFLSFSLS